ncbi:hypothetical protein BD310DRAFT_524044 [Dichomitus squalens]|uniref:Mating-type protein A-alpha/beta 1 N-terminal domain-containing protein n=1 Tax=Dichomitus squalens TaxID=114155 RepID=A0A4Q9Q9N2_9APHY|nr:hypothetical protein BD310DRAFT_524044 [Dichomitus squalens]
MHALRDRLLLAEDDFLAALAEGDGAVVAFNERWEALVADVDAVLESTGLDEQTSALVHSVAFRIATLADTSAEVFESSDLITSDLVAQVEDLVSQLRLEDNTLSVSPPPSHPVSLASPSHSTVCPDLEDSASRRKRRGSSNGTPDRRKRQRYVYRLMIEFKTLIPFHT